jgi:hypothetical protein
LGKYSKSLAIREMQIKTILRFHLTMVKNGYHQENKQQQILVRMRGWGVGAEGILIHCWWECKLVQPLWKSVWRYLNKLKTDLPYDPAK